MFFKQRFDLSFLLFFHSFSRKALCSLHLFGDSFHREKEGVDGPRPARAEARATRRGLRLNDNGIYMLLGKIGFNIYENGTSKVFRENIERVFYRFIVTSYQNSLIFSSCYKQAILERMHITPSGIEDFTSH